jgi:transposase InsO family protein
MDTGYTAGKRFVFLIIVDDFSRFSWLIMIDSKTDTFQAFKQVIDPRNNEHAPYRLAFMRMDNGTEFDNKTMTGWCEKEGVVQEWSGRYRHDQNGVAERRVQIF